MYTNQAVHGQDVHQLGCTQPECTPTRLYTARMYTNQAVHGQDVHVQRQHVQGGEQTHVNVLKRTP